MDEDTELEMRDILKSSSSFESQCSNFPCILILGMAGSGKTTFVQKVTNCLHSQNKIPYVINLDPACENLNYPVNIDIRDTVNYKKVMHEYKLGPNGAIVTSLNLFATKFDQVLNLISQQSSCPIVLFDTPGQIEVFTWSASGSLICETLAAAHPTVIAYVVDVARSTSPTTFMSNMLYACSVLYRTQLPLILVLNKIDVVEARQAELWMRDFEVFLEAIEHEKHYVTQLNRSLALALDDFYKDLPCVGVSALTGEGIAGFLELIEQAKDDFIKNYWPNKKHQMDEKQKLMETQLQSLDKDFEEESLIHCKKESSGGFQFEYDKAESDSSELNEDEIEKQEDKSFQDFLKSNKNKIQ